MRKFVYWYLPLVAALIAAATFASGFYSYVRGDIGTPVNVETQSQSPAKGIAPRDRVAPIVVGDSLARGIGDESGLGIGGRLVDNLKRRRVPVNTSVNLAISGARTADLIRQLESPNVRRLLGESNAIIISIGGNDLWGDNMRNANVANPDQMMTTVLDRLDAIVKTVRTSNATARVFVIGLYNPFGKTPMGVMIKPLLARWNGKVAEHFAGDPNLVVVQTADIFEYRDRLSFDRFHPNGEAYELIARRIADAY